MSDSTSVTSSEDSIAAKILHPLLSLIASASNNELAWYVDFLKEDNKISQRRVPCQIHTKSDERSRLVRLSKALGHAIDELITLVQGDFGAERGPTKPWFTLPTTSSS